MSQYTSADKSFLGSYSEIHSYIAPAKANNQNSQRLFKELYALLTKMPLHAIQVSTSSPPGSGSSCAGYLRHLFRKWGLREIEFATVVRFFSSQVLNWLEQRENEYRFYMIRESRYLGYLLCSKNATRGSYGKGKPTTIRQTRRRLIDSLTEDSQITIEHAVVEWAKFDLNERGVLRDRCAGYLAHPFEKLVVV